MQSNLETLSQGGLIRNTAALSDEAQELINGISRSEMKHLVEALGSEQGAEQITGTPPFIP